jgi:hypothetical protein
MTTPRDTVLKADKKFEGWPSSYEVNVINAFDGGSLASIDDWWVLWKKFMFHTKIDISRQRYGASSSGIKI